MGNVVKSWAELGSIKVTLARQAHTAATREAEQAATLTREPTDEQLFRRTVGRVLPLRRRHNRASIEPPKPPPEARQRQLDDDAVLREAISDEMDVERLLETDEGLSYRRCGLGPSITSKLRRGAWVVNAELDLHGLRTDDARERLGQFLRQAQRHHWRCVRIVHGKGYGSPGRVPVLKAKVHRWLIQKNDVLAFVQARASEGGAGALIVLLTANAG